MTVEDYTQHTKVTAKQVCHSILGFNKCHNSDFAFVKPMMTAAYVIWHLDIAQVHPGKIRSQSLCNFTWPQRLGSSRVYDHGVIHTCMHMAAVIIYFSWSKGFLLAVSLSGLQCSSTQQQLTCQYKMAVPIEHMTEKASRSDVDLPYSVPVHHYCPEWQWP